MNEQIVKVEKQLPQIGGQGMDFSSKLFRLKPATLTISQGMTQAEGAIPGKLRIVETGEQFTSLKVVMLLMPQEQRSWYIGEGNLKRIPENLMCFSRDLIRPDERSKQPQALTCSSCQYSQWNNDIDPAVPPACETFYYVIFIDTVTQIPLKMYIRSTSKKPFEAAMQNIARKFKLLKAKGENPNIYDISFELKTKKRTARNGAIGYVLDVDGQSFSMITPEEAAAFGEIYMQYTSYKPEVEAEDEGVTAQTVINNAVEEDIVI